MSYLGGVPADERDFPALLDIKAAFGFIPNFFRAQTLRPDLIDSEVGLIGTILIKEGALTRRQKEYIFLACSADNLSTYCVTAHCEIVRVLGIELSLVSRAPSARSERNSSAWSVRSRWVVLPGRQSAATRRRDAGSSTCTRRCTGSTARRQSARKYS